MASQPGIKLRAVQLERYRSRLREMTGVLEIVAGGESREIRAPQLVPFRESHVTRRHATRVVLAQGYCSVAT